MEATTQIIDLKNIDKSDWQTFRFDKIAQKISERVDPNETDLDTYIGLTHIDGEDIHIRRTGTSDDVKGTKLRFYPGDVIFGRRRAYQRKAAIATMHGFCSAHALVLRANPDVIDLKLFPFFLHSDQFMHRAVDISVGSLSPTINWGKLKVQEFQIPPKEKQAHLAELLWSLDDVIENEKQLLERLENTLTVKISVLLKKNNLDTHIRLKELYKNKFNSIDPSELGDEEVAHYSLPSYLENFKPEIVPASSIKSNKILIEGETVLFSKLNPSTPKIWGIKKGGNYKKLGSTEWLPVNPNNDFTRNYLLAYLSSRNFLNRVMRLVQGTSNSHKRISPKMFYKLKIPNMSYELKERIENVYLKNKKALKNVELKIESNTKLLNNIINKIF